MPGLSDSFHPYFDNSIWKYLFLVCWFAIRRFVRISESQKVPLYFRPVSRPTRIPWKASHYWSRLCFFFNKANSPLPSWVQQNDQIRNNEYSRFILKVKFFLRARLLITSFQTELPPNRIRVHHHTDILIN